MRCQTQRNLQYYLHEKEQVLKWLEHFEAIEADGFHFQQIIERESYFSHRLELEEAIARMQQIKLSIIDRLNDRQYDVFKALEESAKIRPGKEISDLLIIGQNALAKGESELLRLIICDLEYRLAA